MRVNKGWTRVGALVALLALVGCGSDADTPDDGVGAGGEKAGDGDGDGSGNGDGDGDDGGNGDGDGDDKNRPIPESDCKTDIDCDDGLYCTGVESCKTFDGYKLCQSGDRIDCDDGISCTVDECSEEDEECVSTAPDADGDGHLAAACEDAEGDSLGDDCDDDDPNRFPGNVELCDAENRDEDCNPRTFGERDADADGYLDASCCNEGPKNWYCGDDCDDREPSTHPTQVEICDQLDNNCDGEVDEGVGISGYADTDGDRHGDPDSPVTACPSATHFSLLGDDCDDSALNQFTGHPEICDAVDNDCDGIVDEFTLAVTWYVDADEDGFGDAGGGVKVSCEPLSGYSILPLDCDDSAAGINPASDERCDGLDNDCNGLADFFLGPNDVEDDDRDGSVDAACGGIGADCDDGNPDVYPGAPGICDGLDNDCDGQIDGNDQEFTWYADSDSDGYGDEDVTTKSCSPPRGFVAQGGDCDDTTSAIHPGIKDECGRGDEDCDGDVDENAVMTAYYADADGDGAGGGEPLLACVPPAGYGLLPTDCDDANPDRFEGNPEVCDDIDNDCDEGVDNAPGLCNFIGTVGTCEAGACSIDTCLDDYLDCDEDAANGCEVDTSLEVAHCGACESPCPEGENATSTCVDSLCGIDCNEGFVDCDLSGANGCEANFLSDPANCGGCDLRCDDGPEAPATCANGLCERECSPGYKNCNEDWEDGCEIRPEDDPTHCGVCGNVCESEEVCSRGICQPTLYPSDGSDGEFAPTTSQVLASGIYYFTNITIPQGVTITTDIGGYLELYATGDIIIEGAISANGSAGRIAGVLGTPTSCATTAQSAGGGETGHPGGAGTLSAGGGVCAIASLGGIGGLGTAGSGYCGPGGNRGGGGGGSCTGAGGGGGGLAGGAGGAVVGTTGGTGGSLVGQSTGGLGRADMPGLGGETGLAFYGGAEGTVACGGGGSIGLAASLDLSVASYFQVGSAGGGGGGGMVTAGFAIGGGGGGGAGALRLFAGGVIWIGQNGSITANGGRGGQLKGAGIYDGGGGGSGGLVYLAARELLVQGSVTARGGLGGCDTVGAGNGGLGRIRLSVLPERCDITGTFDPPLEDDCNVTVPAVPGKTYIDTYPF